MQDRQQILQSWSESIKSDVTIATATKKANGKSVLMLTTLGAKNGTEVTLTVSGEDEEEVFTQLDDMFKNHFYED